jgi:hypothetical protein
VDVDRHNDAVEEEGATPDMEETTMPETRTCYCGHVEDEHVMRPTGPGECTVVGGQTAECDCFQFEEDPEADDE